MDLLQAHLLHNKAWEVENITCMKYVRKHQSSAFVMCEDIALQAWNAEESERMIRSISQKILLMDGSYFACVHHFAKLLGFSGARCPNGGDL